MRNIRYSLLLWVIASTLVACTLISPPDDQVDEVATRVAQTLDAMTSQDETPTSKSTSTGPDSTTVPVPDTSQKIVYTDNQNLWIVRLGSDPQQLSFDGKVERVRISSNGTKIAFTRRESFEDNGELFAINPDGSGESLLLSREDFNSLYPSPAGTAGFDIGQMLFRPGTHTVFFNTVEVFEGLGQRPTNDLFMVDLDTGELSAVLPAGAGGFFRFSPNGKKIAIIRPDSISVINGDGSDYLPELLTYSPVLTYSEFQYYAQPVWSEDSRTIGVALPSDDPLAEEAFGEVWHIPANGDPPISFGRINGDFYFTQVFTNPTLSPGLDRVVYTRSTDVPNQRLLLIANADGSEETLFDTGAINWFSWAPDGVHFVYSKDVVTNLTVALDGGTPQFTLEGSDLYWIEDNQYLLFSGSPANWRMSLGQIDGSSILISNVSGDYIDYDASD